MRGADDAHIDRDRAAAAYPDDRALFQHPQQPGLQRQRHLADFIEKQRAAMCRFKQSCTAAAARAGERAIFIAEQFRLQQGFRQRAAIDCHKRSLGARMHGQAACGFAMDGLRHQFLAAAGFAMYQYRGRRTGEQCNGVPHLLHHG